eukprot:m.139620 g.139620  ORF g.139620 m.139620 type:complete len:81 (-) comp14021_c0_seq1:109-351(-)
MSVMNIHAADGKFGFNIVGSAQSSGSRSKPGIFVSQVEPGSPAALQGLSVGDQIIELVSGSQVISLRSATHQVRRLFVRI